MSQLTLSEKTEVKKLGHATRYLVVSQSSPSRIQTNMRKYNPAIHAKHEGWNFNFGNTPLDWIQELLE